MKSLLSVSDENLVRMYKGGDDAAFETLLMRHKNGVYSYIFSFVKEEDASNDIFQETFIKVINCIRRGDYTESGKFKFWVMRIARNLVIDHMRLGAAAGRSLISTEDESNPLNRCELCDESIEDAIISEQSNDELMALVAMLPPSQREIVMLRFFEDLSFKEIAELTGVSINTSLGRMRYALINLRKMMNKRG